MQPQSFLPGVHVHRGELIYTRSRDPEDGETPWVITSRGGSMALSAVPPHFGISLPYWLPADVTTAELERFGPPRWSATSLKTTVERGGRLDAKKLFLRLSELIEDQHRLARPAYLHVTCLVVMLSYVFPIFAAVPYLHILIEPSMATGPLAGVLQALTFNGRQAAHMTSSAIYRFLRFTRSTMIIEENVRGEAAWTRAVRAGSVGNVTVATSDRGSNLVHEWNCYGVKVFISTEEPQDDALRAQAIQVVGGSHPGGPRVLRSSAQACVAELRDDLYRFGLQRASDIIREYEAASDEDHLSEELERALPLLVLARVLDQEPGPELRLYHELIEHFSAVTRQRDEVWNVESERLALGRLVLEFTATDIPVAEKGEHRWYLAARFRDFVNASDIFERAYQTKALGEKLNRWGFVAARRQLRVRDPKLLGKVELKGRVLRQAYLFNSGEVLAASTQKRHRVPATSRGDE